MIPEGVEWELVIVDNNSTDETVDVAHRFMDRLPLRILSEVKPGKSHALNLAAQAAKGDYILWTDDDAFVCAAWLSEYVAAFRRWPDAAFFGGPVVPSFDECPPRWLARGIAEVPDPFAIRDLGSEPLRFTETVLPYGVNLAVRTVEQRRFLYDTKLGPQPQSEVRGEETDMLQRMLADGLEGWWVPNAIVKHWIPRSRQTLRYIRRYYLGAGATLAIQDDCGDHVHWFGKPRWMWRQALVDDLKYRCSRVKGMSPRALRLLHISSVSWGRLLSYRRDRAAGHDAQPAH
jgi:glycosyltransferase involved in cell wall biosynthesis